MNAAPLWRIATATVIAAMLLVAMAVPAVAHGRGSEATNYDSRVVNAPQIAGVVWQIHGGDQYLSVTNTTDTVLEVPGYQDEPYLRVGPDGIQVNTASEAYYVNADRYAEVGTIPPDVGPDVQPRWERIAEGRTYAWHDHRVHWMSPALPPQVSDPDTATLITTWEVPFVYDGQEEVVEGELHWIPSPSPVPWLAVALVLTLPALAGLRSSSGAGGGAADWMRRTVRPAAVVLGVVSLLNVVHLIDDFVAVPLPLGTQITAALQTALFIALGLAGAVVASRGRDGAFTALGVGAGGILVGQGLLYLDVMAVSQAASVAPDWFARLVIALSLLQALPVGIVAVVGNRRLAAVDADELEPDEQPAAAG